MKRLICLVILVHLMTTPCHARPGEIDTGAMDQTSLFVTIYNQDMALVKEKRAVTLPKGESTLAFRDVSGQIIPETALLKSKGLRVVEQNFEFDLLSPASLLAKFTGETVGLIKTHPETGQETRQDARVLATHNGVVLETGTGIETGIPGRLLFPHIPANLRTSPTLTMTVQNDAKKNRELELSYLTHGLTWRADYVAELNPDDDRLNLKAWVTLTNTSRTDYLDATLQLVAGEIHLAPREMRQRAMPMMMDSAKAKGGFAREEMFEYHLYTLERKTTLKNNQTKQVALLQAENVPCTKEYFIDGQGYYFSRSMGPGGEKPKVQVLLHLENTKENNLGMPLPKGIIRVYKQDRQGMLQFAGEDRMDHTPDKGSLKLTLGNAFDITAEKKQTDFKKLSSSSKGAFRYQSAYEIKIANAKTSPVTVTVSEPVPGDWRITRQSHAHTKASSNRAQWQISVPARGETTLSYTVQTK